MHAYATDMYCYSGAHLSLWSDKAGSLLYSTSYVFKLVSVNLDSLTNGVSESRRHKHVLVPTSDFLSNVDKHKLCAFRNTSTY